MDKFIKKLDKIQTDVAKEVVTKKSSDAKAHAIRAIKKAKLFLAEVEAFVEEEPVAKPDLAEEDSNAEE
jgi:hypothetical protein